MSNTIYCLACKTLAALWVGFVVLTPDVSNWWALGACSLIAFVDGPLTARKEAT